MQKISLCCRRALLRRASLTPFLKLLLSFGLRLSEKAGRGSAGAKRWEKDGPGSHIMLNHLKVTLCPEQPPPTQRPPRVLDLNSHNLQLAWRVWIEVQHHWKPLVGEGWPKDVCVESLSVLLSFTQPNTLGLSQEWPLVGHCGPAKAFYVAFFLLKTANKNWLRYFLRLVTNIWMPLSISSLPQHELSPIVKLTWKGKGAGEQERVRDR